MPPRATTAERAVKAPPGEASRAEKKRASLQEGVLRAAIELFAERGFHGTSVPDVMARAGIGAGSLYRLFPGKEALVNAVFRDAKGKLERALRDDLDLAAPPRALFDAFWARIVAFARADPVTFRFLELQDHAPYLDADSRAQELSVLGPILLACVDLQRRGAVREDVRPDAMIALVWGAFVGLVKAERLGYLKLDDALLASSRDALWRAFAAGPSQTPAGKSGPSRWGRERPQTPAGKAGRAR